ncbi:MAG: anaerobic sulfatase maturase [Spirochaetales bacterium]|nr:anaerobic sulfatase maturase [Spirochaetales bacterium]
MKAFSLLVKPASADCNLRCEYCFYLDHLCESEKTRMSDSTLEKMVRSYMQTSQPQYSIAFQGGEPTLMGLPFFKKLVELEKKYAPPGASIANALQTNGTLIDDKMAAFFGEYKFLLGVSLDGSPELHDHYRKTAGKKGSHQQVLKGLELLKKHKVEYNILTLVNDRNSREPELVYDYLYERGEHFLQFIPCVEFKEDGITPEAYSVTPGGWGDFLIGIFDRWYEHRYQVSVRMFDSLLNKMVLGHPSTCDMDTNCCHYFVVEYDGSVYPCDFYVRDDLKLGNVNSDSWSSFLTHSTYTAFGACKMNFQTECSSCPWLSFCHGDCQKHRTGEENNGLSYLCPGLKKFYKHAMPRLRTLADQIIMDRRQRGM